MKPIYLDHCSTTPLDPSVLDSMLPYFKNDYGNPGTSHELVGGVVKRAILRARESVADLIGCNPGDLIWTSGATESNNLAILGFAATMPTGRRHLITQVTEHSSVIEPCRHLESNGWQITRLSVDEEGRIDLMELENSICDETSLVSIMWGNNEIGTVHPLREIATICARHGVTFHCDATQAIGKVPVNLDDVEISLMTLSAHKLYGPKGVGVLFVRDLGKRLSIAPQLFGGGQEKGLRAGTQNVPCIVGMGAACKLANTNISHWRQHLQQLRDIFETTLFNELRDVSLNGDRQNRLPHISNIAFHGTDNESLLTMLPGLVASTGSACHVADFTPSHVLRSLHKTPDVSECSLRFAVGKDTMHDDVVAASEQICVAVQRLRNS